MLSRASARKVQRNRTKTAHIPAPVGGLNTVDAGYALPPYDCPLLYNMIGGENGSRIRRGYKEWCTGLAGVADNTVRSILPFHGSGANGSKDRLFACTSGHIYSVGASSAVPASVLNFASSAGDAGWGVARGLVNSGGQHFLLLTDEQNGYHVYSETNDTWQVVAQQASAAWQTAHAYVLNDRVVNNGITYKCTTGGNSAASGGPTGVGAGIADGTAVWAYEPTISGVDPATFVFVAVWKNWVLFVEKDTSRMWVASTVRSLYGPVTSFDFGAQFAHGGNLVGLWSSSGDYGVGMDAHLVAVSSSGDIVVYKGTDPNDATKFSIVGDGFVGGVPAGRRIASPTGSDLLIAGSLGVIPLSKSLVSGAWEQTDAYVTQKIANEFSKLVTTYGGVKGWAMDVHPEDGTLVVTVPVADGQPTTQLAMSLRTGGWSKYRDLPILSMGVWGKKLYFGTADGRVCINTDYLDNVDLAASTYSLIKFSGITAFRNGDNPRQKQVKEIRATYLYEGGLLATTEEARYRYDLTEATAPSPVPSNNSNVFDVAQFDIATFGGDFATQQIVRGASGMGPDVAVAFAGSAGSRTVLVGIDLVFEEGGVD
jgi:hypothetical protein